MKLNTLTKQKKLTQEIMELVGCDLDDLFWDNPPDNEKLDLTLKKVLTNIAEIRTIPIEKRKFDF